MMSQQAKRMQKTARFLLTLAVALVLMLCFRALAFTVCTVEGQGFAPQLHRGDRVLVNRWSYGLRVGGDGGLFSYGRIGRQTPEKGDIVAFENPKNTDEVLLCRCKGLPGDTIVHDGQLMMVPGLKTCADADHYWLEAIGTAPTLDSRTLGFIAEEFIIGRATMVLYNHDPLQSLLNGWNGKRTLLPL